MCFLLNISISRTREKRVTLKSRAKSSMNFVNVLFFCLEYGSLVGLFNLSTCFLLIFAFIEEISIPLQIHTLNWTMVTCVCLFGAAGVSHL